MVKVEIERNRGGCKEEETAEFATLEEAIEWADVMREHYGYRKIWIEGSEYNASNTK